VTKQRRLARGPIGPVLAFLVSTSAFAQTGYFGIPDGFDYPADKATLEGFRSNQNLSALRKHSWMLFAGMTQMTTDGTPFWETWYQAGETFRPAGPTPQGPRRINREFSTPSNCERRDWSHTPPAIRPCHSFCSIRRTTTISARTGSTSSRNCRSSIRRFPHPRRGINEKSPTSLLAP